MPQRPRGVVKPVAEDQVVAAGGSGPADVVGPTWASDVFFSTERLLSTSRRVSGLDGRQAQAAVADHPVSHGQGRAVAGEHLAANGAVVRAFDRAEEGEFARERGIARRRLGPRGFDEPAGGRVAGGGAGGRADLRSPATANTSPAFTKRSSGPSAPPRKRIVASSTCPAVGSTVPHAPKSRSSQSPAKRPTSSAARVLSRRTRGEARPLKPSCWRLSRW